MTVRYVCKNCGAELYRYEVAKWRYLRPPCCIIYKLRGSCPHCGAKLTEPSMDDINFTVRRARKRKYSPPLAKAQS